MNWLYARLTVVSLVFVLGAGCDSVGGGNPSPGDVLGGPDVAGVSDATLAEGREAPDAPSQENYPGEAGATGVFELERVAFYDQPYPSNTRLRANGRPNLQDFPNPLDLPILQQYIKVAEQRIDGFGANSSIYFRFDGPLAPVSFPTVYGTIDPQAPVFLVNVSADSKYYGEFIPVDLRWWNRVAPSPDYYLLPNTLIVRPVGGFPLRAGDTYACVVTRRLRDEQGRHLGVNPLVERALSNDPSAPLYNLFGPLRTWLDETEGVAASDVAIATVFKTQNSVKEMVDAARFIWDEVDPELVGPVESKPTGNDYLFFEGAYLAPNFQTGEPPYETEGEIVFDGKDNPKIQWMEKITFALTVPKGKTMPASGWPVVMYSHGTGGSYKGFTTSTAERFTDRGIAVIGIDQPLHGKRYNGPPIDVEFYSFNFTNPYGARSLFRQAGLDFITLTKLLEKMTFTSSGQKVRFDKDRIGYFGHSQGGLTGALFLAVAPHLRAAVLSGAGGGLSDTILLRKELDSGTNFDIKAALEGVLELAYDDELDLFHPVLTLVQTLVDATDPINYSPFYLNDRFVDNPVNVLITEGVDDPYTPAVTTEALAIAGGIPPIAPVAHPHPGFDLLELGAVALPVQGNLQAQDGKLATAALAQFTGYGHFVAFDDATCIAYYLNMFQSAFGTTGPPVLAK
jgi:pimeloyl-ACP methyl ester carboxylesterase